MTSLTLLVIHRLGLPLSFPQPEPKFHVTSIHSVDSNYKSRRHTALLIIVRTDGAFANQHAIHENFAPYPFFKTPQAKEKEKRQRQQKAVRKACLSLANILLVITTFAGAFTLNAYFNISCPDSLAATFLHASSMLFLSAPFGLFIIYLLLFSFPEDEKVPYALFLTVLLQFVITGLALATAILYVSCIFLLLEHTPS